MKPFLALFRAGKSSLHPHAVARLAAQNFDYALSWFADEPPAAEGAVFVHLQKGAKWPGLYETIRAHWDVISQYRYVWLPDDDLLCVPEDVSRMFSICDDLALDLAQPALTPDSYFSHVITMQHAAYQLRFTNFVEIMAPVLSVDLLARVFHTLKDTISGYGLDGVWPRFSQLGKVAIIDDTPVRHTRPVGGPNYAFSKQAGLHPVQEEWLSAATHFVETPSDLHLNFGGLLQTGDAICIGKTPNEIDCVLGSLIDSCAALPVTALQLSRYLSNHLSFWSGETHGHVRYPRETLGVVLGRLYKDKGIRFVKPEESGAGKPGEMPPPRLATH
jgi:hypothetical protein